MTATPLELPVALDPPITRAETRPVLHDRTAALGTGRILIVSNRLPVTIDRQGETLTLRSSSGGLATGLAGPHARSGGLWFGWPGAVGHEVASRSHPLANAFDARRIVPIALTAEEVRGFYDDVSNGILWPVFHDRLDRLPLQSARWDLYERVNARFADVVAANYAPGDRIWVHDYQLMRLPALLRERIPDARIGFFLHIPFPSAGVFEALPWRKSLLTGLLGADVIGFHTTRYVAQFREALARLLGVHAVDEENVIVDGRPVRIGAFPMGIDATAFARRAESLEGRVVDAPLRPTDARLLVGVDRLDYSKGIPRRLLAYELLLKRHPRWRGRVQLVQIAVPSRDGVHAYRHLRREVEELVGRISGEFATPTWAPIQYLRMHVSPETLVGLYRTADVMLVTPVRDGMNLVAKEFVASRIDGDGVLVLSEFAGAAEELVEAIQINPYDSPAVADAIDAALSMTEVERRQRMARLRERVFRRDVHDWADRFLAMLDAPRSLA